MNLSLQDLLAEAKKMVQSIDAKSLSTNSEYLIIDVRESEEVAGGLIPGATPIPRGQLELRIEKVAPKREQKVALYCAGGTRSVFAGASLLKMGYKNIVSLDGGIKAWKDAGFPIQENKGLDSSLSQRYMTQMRLSEVGEEGQKKLLATKVLIIGAGGLGSPVAYYLAAAGVGTIGLIDDDKVDTSNLQRQILHTTERVGIPKVDSAFMTLKSLNPSLKIETYKERLTVANVDQLVPNYDIIVDGCDNFQTRYLVNDACLKHGKINVHGSVFWFQGQASIFCASEGPCYRCLYPEPPSPDMAPNCAEAGVLGVLPGTVGLIEATEVLKIILKIGKPLIGRMLVYDALEMKFRELNIRKDPNCTACKSPKEIKYQNYEQFCSLGGSNGKS